MKPGTDFGKKLSLIRGTIEASVIAREEMKSVPDLKGVPAAGIELEHQTVMVEQAGDQCRITRRWKPGKTWGEVQGVNVAESMPAIVSIVGKEGQTHQWYVKDKPLVVRPSLLGTEPLRVEVRGAVEARKVQMKVEFRDVVVK